MSSSLLVIDALERVYPPIKAVTAWAALGKESPSGARNGLVAFISAGFSCMT